jgi:hypothetical protein
VNIKAAFNNLKDFLIANVPELGKCLEHFADPFIVGADQFIILPDGTQTSGQKILFKVRIFASTAGKKIDDIPQTQMALVQKMYSLINLESVDNITQMQIETVDFFDPATPTHNVGLTVFEISCYVGDIDDCDFGAQR